MIRQTIFGVTGLLIASFLVSCVAPSFAATHALRSVSPAQQPDNTRTNKNERGDTTADQQKETAADRELAKKVRQSIVEDKTLSTYGHNVKVIARDGEVTLQGPVKSENEKAAIEAKATSIAGTGKVRNELIVKAQTGSS